MNTKERKLRFPVFWVSCAGVSIAFVLGLAILFRDSLARIAWQKHGWGEVALFLNNRDANLAMQLGNFYFGETLGRKAYDLARAKQAFLTAVSQDNKIANGHYQLARIYFIEGKMDTALSEINQELQNYPYNQRSFYIRGLIRGTSGDLSGAESDFRNFVAWAPKEWAGYNDLAWILLKEQKYRETEELMSQALHALPDADKNPWLWNSLGVAQLNLGSFSEATQSFERATSLADSLDFATWQAAYPGNSPQDAEQGLALFKKAINDNLQRAKSKIMAK